MNWLELETSIRELANQITNTPDHIVAIARGGLIPARLLATRLDIDSIFCLTIKKEAGQRIIMSEIIEDLTGKSVLLVEDALESGESLIAAKNYLESKGASVQTLAIYIQPNTKTRPNYYLKAIKKIPMFPWE